MTQDAMNDLRKLVQEYNYVLAGGLSSRGDEYELLDRIEEKALLCGMTLFGVMEMVNDQVL